MPGHKAEAAGERKIHYEHEKLRKIVAIEEYVARMEDVLDLYAATPDPQHPAVCFDESPIQLIGETRPPIPAAPGRVARIDYEYRRCGTVNLFVMVDAHRPWRHVTVSERRTALDFAACLRALADVHYPQAKRIRVVLDNLSTHTPGSLYEAFPPALVGPGRRPCRAPPAAPNGAASRPSSRSWPQSSGSPRTARRTRPGDRKPSGPPARGPLVNRGCSFRHGSILSGVGASGNPGAFTPLPDEQAGPGRPRRLSIPDAATAICSQTSVSVGQRLRSHLTLSRASAKKGDHATVQIVAGVNDFHLPLMNEVLDDPAAGQDLGGIAACVLPNGIVDEIPGLALL